MNLNIDKIDALHLIHKQHLGTAINRRKRVVRGDNTFPKWNLACLLGSVYIYTHYFWLSVYICTHEAKNSVYICTIYLEDMLDSILG